MPARGPGAGADPFSDDRAAQSTLPPISTSPVDFFAGVAIPHARLSPQQQTPASARSMNPFADPASPAVPSPKLRKDEAFRWSDLSSPTRVPKREAVSSEGSGTVSWAYPAPSAPLAETNPDPSFATHQRAGPADNVVEDDNDDFEMVTPRPFANSNPSAHVSVATSLASADRSCTTASRCAVSSRLRAGRAVLTVGWVQHVSSMTSSTDADPFVYDRDASAVVRAR